MGTFDDLIQSLQKCFSIRSTNIQGTGAKFDKVMMFIEDVREKHNFKFSVICLHEYDFKDNN